MNLRRDIWIIEIICPQMEMYGLLQLDLHLSTFMTRLLQMVERLQIRETHSITCTAAMAAIHLFLALILQQW